MRPRAKILTPFPSVEETSSELGLSERRVRKLLTLLGKSESGVKVTRSKRKAAKKSKKK